LTKEVIYTRYKELEVAKELPYSQGIRAGDFIFCASQGGVDPEKGEAKEGVAAQTKQALENLKEVLEAAGATMEDIVKTTVFLKNLDDFKEMNQVYRTYFKKYPARTTVQISKLPLDLRVEIEAIAYRPR
jgi:2-iminobutanoate/2-iminopropanoate deaminase